MPVNEILKVIYAPHRAFKEIIQNPRYIGPIVIMILFVAANLASTYTLFVRTYVEETFPAKEEWTENADLWQIFNGNVPSANYTDYIKGNIYGNRSIEFKVKDSTEISMQLDNLASVNCSGPEGYTKIYLRIKCTSPNVYPENVSVYLYSTSLSNFFYRSLKENFSNVRLGIWNNLTIPLIDGKWHKFGNADWNGITGLKMVFKWHEKHNITVLVDGLFFGGLYKPYAENASTYLAYYSAFSFMQFVVRWVLFAGVIHIMSRAFKANSVWRVTLVLVGFALVTMVIQALINAAVFSATLPALKYSFEYIGGVEGESEAAYNKILEETWLVNQIYSYVQIAIIVWTIVLCGIAVRQSTNFSWSKSFLLVVVAYFVVMTVERFLIG